LEEIDASSEEIVESQRTPFLEDEFNWMSMEPLLAPNVCGIGVGFSEVAILEQGIDTSNTRMIQRIDHLLLLMIVMNMILDNIVESHDSRHSMLRSH
jgi:hypothetical protein